jgi:hypothetical protein
MKRILVCAVLALLVAGCGGLQARGDAAVAIDANAAVAAANLATIDVTDDATLTKTLTTYDGVLQKYKGWATGNLFAYWFDSTKLIFVNATYYDLITKTAVLSTETAKRLTNTLPPGHDWLKATVIAESPIFTRVKEAKDNVAPAP